MKNLFIISALALLPASSMAQDYSAPPSGPGYERGIDVRKLRFGIYVAPSIAYMKPTTSKDDAGEYGVTNNGSKIGYMYGLMVDYQFAPNYALTTGLQVSNGGGKILAERINTTMASNTVLRADFNYNLTYLQVPLALKLRTDDYNGFRFFGQLGLTLGFNIAKKATYTVNFVNASGIDTTVGESNVKLKGGISAIAPINLELNIGIGAEYTLSDRLKGYLGLFFNNGFLPDATNPDKYDLSTYQGASFHDGNTRLNNFALRVGLFF